MSYRDLVNKNLSFLRSIRVDRDLDSSRSYIVTPIFVHVVRRIVGALTESRGGAYSVTGPYGAGKSAAMLQIAQILQGTGDPQTLSQIAEIDPSTKEWIGHIPICETVMINGRQGPLARAILEALQNRFGNTIGSAHVDNDDMSRVMDIIKHLIRHNIGIFLCIDELGKFLEYYSYNPEHNDLHLLQLLAEEAHRSEVPFVIVGVLHQAFEEYGSRLLVSQRQEFLKIHGRFEDIAFHQPLSDVLRIISGTVSRIWHKDTREEFQALRSEARYLAERAGELHILPPGIDVDTFIEVASNSVPLHPAVTLMLGPLFHQLAQNERSIFSFLASFEPMGLQDFLDHEESPTFYTMENLFDYLMASMGTTLFHGMTGRRWSEIDHAMARIRDERSDEGAIIKALGILSVSGQRYGLMATPEFLEWALTGRATHSGLDTLQQKSVVIFRNYSRTYRLWDGSDIDLNQALIEASNHVPHDFDLADMLNQIVRPRPFVARRFSAESGSLRWFDAKYISAAAISRLSEDHKDQGDGRVYLWLSTGDIGTEGVSLLPWQVVVHIPMRRDLPGAIGELLRLTWVRDHTPGLRDDVIAWREVIERIRDVQLHIEGEIEAMRQGGRATLFTHWDQTTATTGDIGVVLSRVCDNLYPLMPTIHNDFVNRDALTSSSTAARHNLIEKLIVSNDVAQLGIEKYPPELSIYLSTLLNTGLHVLLPDGRWVLREPEENSPWAPAWDFMKVKSREGSVLIVDLWNALHQSPHGIKRGLLPILTVAFSLVYKDILAVFENGRLIPDLSLPVAERMMRNPERFSIYLTEIQGTRQVLVDKLIEAKLTTTQHSNGLLSLVSGLVRFVGKLPEFVKVTSGLDDRAKRVLECVMDARDAGTLLFFEIPKALGYPEICETTDSDIAERVVKDLYTVVVQLRDIYVDMLTSVREKILGVLGLDAGASRETRRKHWQLIADFTTDYQVKSFLQRALEGDPADLSWAEPIATIVRGKTPVSWSDQDVQEFEFRLKELQRRLQNVMKIADAGAVGTGVVRLGITAQGRDLETVVVIPKTEVIKGLVTEARRVIGELCSTEGATLEAVLAYLVQDVLSPEEEYING